MTPMREIAVSSGESALPGNARPPGFKGTGSRAGGAFTFDWWVTFVDDDGATIPGGTATVQWYAVDVNGDAVTTPELGGDVDVAALAIASKGVGDKLWPWPIVTDMAAPGGATKIRVFMTVSAAQSSEVDTSALQAAIEAAVAGVPADTISLLNTGTSTLSRVIASAVQAIADAVTAGTIPSDADVAGVPAATATALNTGTTTLSRVEAAVIAALNTGSSTLSRIIASGSISIANKVSDNTIPSDADVQAVPASTVTAMNAGTSTLSRVIASVVQGIADAVTANSIPSKTNVTDVPAQTVTALDTGDTSVSRIAASVIEALYQNTKTSLSGNQPYAAFLNTVTVVGDADGQTAVLVPATGDPNLFNDLLGVIITSSGAGSFGIGNGGGPGQVFGHNFADKGSIYIKGDPFVVGEIGSSYASGPLCRAYNDDITVTSYTNGVTITATPWVRTNTI